MSTTRPWPPPGDSGPQPGGSASCGTPSPVARGPVPARPSVPAEPPSAGTAASAEPAAEAHAPAAAAARTRRLRLVDVSGAVPMARDFTRAALTDWGWLPALTADHRAAAEDVLLVVSELVTNACLHADGPEELRVSCADKVLRLEVTDLGAGAPAPRNPHRAGRPGGHGMFIVQRLCLDWGVVRNENGAGKTVWAELAAPS
ncbi:ATP-binding protein [Streptomyces gamaensis]|uniref:ATP-binding protein n=1 Tax=Streptomyces gamaensis TaxID=1763542 RepID=A0ABW0Z588_9ACTN